MEEQSLVFPEYNGELVELLKSAYPDFKQFRVTGSLSDRASFASSIRYDKKPANGNVGFERFDLRFANGLYLATERVIAAQINSYTASFYDSSKNPLGTLHRQFPGRNGSISLIFSTDFSGEVIPALENTLGNIIILSFINYDSVDKPHYAIEVPARIAECLLYVLRKEYQPEKNTLLSEKRPLELLNGQAHEVITIEYSREFTLKEIERLRQAIPLVEDEKPLLED